MAKVQKPNNPFNLFITLGNISSFTPIQNVDGKDKVIPVLNYVIKHYAMKAYGGVEV
jgi:hypothetical protein